MTLSTTPHRVAFAFAFACLLLATAPAQAEAAGATKSVRDANETISALLKKQTEPGSEEEKRIARKVTDSVRGFLDIDELGRRAMTDHWTKLSASQQSEFLSLLRELVERNYIKGLRANVKYRVKYLGEKAQGANVLVSTEVKTKRNGRPFKIGIDYVVRKEGGKWRAFDVVTDGVGLVENYRAQFNRIVDRKGFDGLMAKMRKKRDSMK